MASRPAIDADMWWHLRLGERILDSGAAVAPDAYSHTFAGALHKNHSALGQLALTLAWRLAGHLGLTVLVSLLATGGMVFLYRAGRGSIYTQAFALVFGAACAAAFWSPRPQMFSFLFGAALMWLLFSLKRQGRDRLHWLPGLLWLWANCHGGYIIGYLLLAAFLAGEMLNRLLGTGESLISPRQWRKLLGLSLLSLILLPLNPLGLEVFAVPFETVSIGGQREHIQEWQPPDFHQTQTWGCLILLALALLATWRSRRRVDACEWLILLGALGMALYSARNLSLFAIAAVPFISAHLDAWLRTKAWMPPRRRCSPLKFAALNAFLIALVALGMLARLHYVSGASLVEQAIAQNFPTRALAHLPPANESRRLFNSYNWGGYLVFAARDQPVFIDGRTDLYREFINEYAAARVTPAWREIFERWHIGVALIETDSYLANQLEADPGWRLDYGDEIASVFLRADS